MHSSPSRIDDISKNKKKKVLFFYLEYLQSDVAVCCSITLFQSLHRCSRSACCVSIFQSLVMLSEFIYQFLIKTTNNLGIDIKIFWTDI